jgi:hypothetical protein
MVRHNESTGMCWQELTEGPNCPEGTREEDDDHCSSMTSWIFQCDKKSLEGYNLYNLFEMPELI